MRSKAGRLLRPVLGPRTRGMARLTAIMLVVGLGGGASAAAASLQVGTVGSITFVGAPGALSTISSHSDLPYVPPQPLDPATARELDRQLARARAVALRYPTVAAARRAGYIEATGYVPGVGAHFMKYSEISGTFVVDDPAMILYDGDRPNSRVAGLAYYVISGPKPPDGFAGPNDVWHQHPGVCVTPSGPELAGDAAQTCRFAGRPAWMLHVWVAPAYPSPEGTFSPENLRIGTASLYRTYNCHIKA